MREFCTSGSVGAPPANPAGLPDKIRKYEDGSEKGIDVAPSPFLIFSIFLSALSSMPLPTSAR